jgi:hypothetical protein
LATSVQTIITVLLQLASVVLLLIGPSPGFTHPTWHDHAFRRVWTVALGWAGVEAIVGIKQGYENITLYRDVLVHVKRISPEDAQIPTERSSYSEHSSPGITRQTTRGSQELQFEEPHGERQPLLQKLPQVNGVYHFSRKAIEREVQNDLDLLVALKAREELEEIYGIPVIVRLSFIHCSTSLTRPSLAHTCVHLLLTSSKRGPQLPRNLLTPLRCIPPIAFGAICSRADTHILSFERSPPYRSRSSEEAISHVAQCNSGGSHSMPVDPRTSSHSLGSAQNRCGYLRLYRPLSISCSFLFWFGFLGSVGVIGLKTTFVLLVSCRRLPVHLRINFIFSFSRREYVFGSYEKDFILLSHCFRNCTQL